MESLILRVPKSVLSEEPFFQLCQDNRELRFERTATGELIILSPTGGETGNRNFDLYLYIDLGNWIRVLD